VVIFTINLSVAGTLVGRKELPDPSKAAVGQQTLLAKALGFLPIRFKSRGQLLVNAQDRRKLFPGHTLSLTGSRRAENLPDKIKLTPPKNVSTITAETLYQPG